MNTANGVISCRVQKMKLKHTCWRNFHFWNGEKRQPSWLVMMLNHVLLSVKRMWKIWKRILPLKGYLLQMDSEFSFYSTCFLSKKLSIYYNPGRRFIRILRLWRKWSLFIINMSKGKRYCLNLQFLKPELWLNEVHLFPMF